MKLKIFADDVKVYLSVCNSGNAAVLQTALNDLVSEWQLPISISKCNILYVGNTIADIRIILITMYYL